MGKSPIEEVLEAAHALPAPRDVVDGLPMVRAVLRLRDDPGGAAARREASERLAEFPRSQPPTRLRRAVVGLIAALRAEGGGLV